MNVGILTSSRADYGIYKPLLKRLYNDRFFNVSIIAFGTHLSLEHGYTINQILDDGYEVKYKINTVPLNDQPVNISAAIGDTVIKFSEFWQQTNSIFDLVFCLGDRYEMFAAVIASIPFQIKLAHLHGGETTIGAIDNIFRHSITLSSKIHFTSTNLSKRRVSELVSKNEDIYNVGAISLENISELNIPSIDEFKIKWGVDFSKKTILLTFHPETVNFENNKKFAFEIVKAVNALPEYIFLITMPNTDTQGAEIRKIFLEKFNSNNKVYIFENLGTTWYFSAMKYCFCMLGNTSSGIIEAASFNKYVMNLGERQKGRDCSSNVINININAEEILKAVFEIEKVKIWIGDNIYYCYEGSKKIVEILKNQNGIRF